MFFIAQLASAQDVKLECNLIIETRYSEGNFRNENSMATVDVQMDEAFKSIKIKNHKIIAILNSIKVEETVSFRDLSDAGKWELQGEEFDSKKNIRTRTNIRIDRNTGKIFFNDRYTESTGFINTSGYGDCTKIDVTKRKF